MLLININERSSPQMYIIFAIHPNFTNLTGLNIKLNILIIKMKPQSAIQMYIIYMTSEFCTTTLVSIAKNNRIHILTWNWQNSKSFLILFLYIHYIDIFTHRKCFKKDNTLLILTFNWKSWLTRGLNYRLYIYIYIQLIFDWHTGGNERVYIYIFFLRATCLYRSFFVSSVPS